MELGCTQEGNITSNVHILSSNGLGIEVFHRFWRNSMNCLPNHWTMVFLEQRSGHILKLCGPHLSNWLYCWHLGEEERGGGTADRLVYNPFSQFGPQLELDSQVQLNFQSDPIALGVPIST